jgi:hypothetical protein
MAYATRDQLKRELEIPSSDNSHDTYLDELLAQATAFIDTQTNRTFSEDPVTVTDEVYDLTDGNRIWLKHTGIKSVTSVKVGQTDPETLDTTAYTWDALGRLVLFGYGRLSRFGDRDYYLGYVRVSYTYDGDGIPKDIEMACLQLAAEVYRNGGANETKEQIGDYSVWYENGKSDVADRVKAVLSAHRVINV